VNAQAGPVAEGRAGRTGDERRRFRSRVPLFPFAALLAAGIVVDRRFSPPLMWTWLVAVAVAVAVLAIRPRKLIATVLVAAGAAGIGAARHHQVWTTRPPSDLSFIDLKDDTPVRVMGVVSSPVEVRQADRSASIPTWQQIDRSTFQVDVESLVGTTEIPVTGAIYVTVTGHLLGVEIGDRLELLGHIVVPGEPRDPDGFDLRRWLKSQGIDRALNVEHPDAIRTIGRVSNWRHDFARTRHRLRGHCERLLADNLSPSVRSVGTSLLLGTTSGLTKQLREEFVNSGTMHVLAISGLHVAILGAMLLTGCRLLSLSAIWSAAILLLTLWGYAVLTDLRPPVVRSAVFGSLVALALPSRRSTSGLNLLSAAAVVMLLWNPPDLFDIGAQLSFLAVAGILWSARWAERWARRPASVLAGEPSTARTWSRWLWKQAVAGSVVTAAIWLFTLPVTMSTFHLVSPIGFVVNLLLVPFSGPLLAAGFATLATGLVAPPLTWAPAWAYEACLQMLLSVVHIAAQTPFGHLSTPGPSHWQLAVYYVLLTLAILLPVASWRKRSWWAFGCAVAVMVGGSVFARTPSELVVTFIDVGHGGAVLFECPGGETILFDAGSFGRAEAAEETIARALQARRVDGLNALVLSHADADHYNAAEGLLDRLPVAAVFLSQAFPDDRQWGTARLCEAVVNRGIPLRLIQAGDSFPLTAHCSLDVLHPAGSFRDALDNAHSVVLRAKFAGRTALVTGDVEKAGVRALMEANHPERVDVFQAPHHGGKMSNTTDLARWSVPRYVIACNRNDAVLPRLNEVYADAEQILTSASHGTISARISRTGEVHVSTTRTTTP
jgi:competence protein ComEC